jgi:hypothetical protein
MASVPGDTPVPSKAGEQAQQAHNAVMHRHGGAGDPEACDQCRDALAAACDPALRLDRLVPLRAVVDNLRRTAHFSSSLTQKDAFTRAADWLERSFTEESAGPDSGGRQ